MPRFQWTSREQSAASSGLKPIGIPRAASAAGICALQVCWKRQWPRSGPGADPSDLADSYRRVRGEESLRLLRADARVTGLIGNVADVALPLAHDFVRLTQVVAGHSNPVPLLLEYPLESSNRVAIPCSVCQVFQVYRADAPTLVRRVSRWRQGGPRVDGIGGGAAADVGSGACG